jgi:hypothetical protein
MRKNSRVSRLFSPDNIREELGLPKDEQSPSPNKPNLLKGSGKDVGETSALMHDPSYFKGGLSTYPFDTKDANDSIVFDEHGYIKYGTIVKILEKIHLKNTQIQIICSTCLIHTEHL